MQKWDELVCVLTSSVNGDKATEDGVSCVEGKSGGSKCDHDIRCQVCTCVGVDRIGF